MGALGQAWHDKFQRAVTYSHKLQCAKAVSQFGLIMEDAKEAFQFDEQDTAYLQALHYLGTCHQAMNNQASALKQYALVLELHEQGYAIADSIHENALLQSTQILVDEGKYTEAESFAKRSLILQNRDFAGNAAYAYKLLGEINKNLGRLVDAGNYYQQAINITARKDPGLLTALAQIHVGLEQYDSAAILFTESLEVIKKTVGDSTMEFARALESKATYHIARQQLPVAEELLKQAITIYDTKLGLAPKSYSGAILNEAYIHRLRGDYDRALERFDVAFKGIRKSRLENEPQYATWISRYLVTKIAARQLDDAERWVMMAKQNYVNQILRFFPNLTEVEKEAFYADIRWRFEAFNSFAIQRYEQNSAIAGVMYDNQLISKAILLNESNKWKKRILASGDVQLITQFADWQQKKHLLGGYMRSSETSARNAIKTLEKEIARMEKALTSRSELFAGNRSGKVPSWKEVQKTLGANEAAIEIVRFRLFDFELGNQFTDKVLYAALVILPKRKQPDLVLFEDGNDLESKYLVNYRNSTLFEKTDSISYLKYWKPLAEVLGETKKVYVSNDGVYNQLNLNTIYNPTSGNYLIDEYDIVVVTNTKDLLENKVKGDANKYAVLLGNPDFGADSLTTASKERGTRPPLSPLPGTRLEVQLINDLLRDQGWERDIYLGRRAAEDQIKKLFKPRILHVATHGFFQEGATEDLDGTAATNPLLNSGLYLSNPMKHVGSDSEEDGILTAYEAMQLNLDDAELVVLSACETGLGEVRNGEGVYGLQRAFKVAGAKNIVMSLWKVNDDVTQELMVAFYKRWLNTNDKTSAFKAAQLELREKYESPFFWGAFMMIGN